MTQKALPNCCEEASIESNKEYVPCNRPATRVIRWAHEGPYRMCEYCADHCISHRGATDVGPYVPSTSENSSDNDLAAVLAEALQDSEAPPEAPQSKLDAVSHWIKEQLRLEDLKESLEEQLKQCNKDLEVVSQQRLPDAMIEAGCSRFDTPEGGSVKVEPKYFAAVTKGNEPEFYQWMADNGHAGAVNTEVVIPLGKGKHSEGQKLVSEINKLLKRNDVKLSESIHWSTLRAFAKEQTLANNELPKSLSVHYVNLAKITRAE